MCRIFSEFCKYSTPLGAVVRCQCVEACKNRNRIFGGFAANFAIFVHEGVVTLAVNV